MLSSGILHILYSHDESHTPETWFANAGPLDRYLPSDVIMGYGISKGHIG